MDLRDLKPLGDWRAPIYFQLYRRFRDAIATGKLAPGDRVPSVRSLTVVWRQRTRCWPAEASFGLAALPARWCLRSSKW